MDMTVQSTCTKQLSLFFDENNSSKESEAQTETVKEEKTAAMIFQSFFINGYVPMKQSEKKMDMIKEEMKKRLQGEPRKRIEFEKTDVIAKWRKLPIYETDYVGLNELLYHHGLLHIISIPTKGLDPEVKEELQPFLLPPEFSVTPNTNNKKAKEVMKLKEVFNVEAGTTEQLTGTFSQLYRIHKRLEDEYKILKAKMVRCPVLLAQKKLPFDYGSITLSERYTGYDIDKIIEWFGVDYILEVGKPNMQELEYFIDTGLVRKEDVDSFRRLVDYRVDFLLMTKEAEEIQNQIFQDKLQRKVELIKQR
jgi:hypothetical protein